MIKLERISKPEQLTKEKQKELTNEYKATKKNVWNKIFIKEQLLEMSYNKCCYCEIRLNEEGKYMEVEHFLLKKEYKDLVVDWDNLLPSCKRCNGKKGEHNAEIEPIINPTIQNPKKHFFLNAYRLYPQINSKLGRTTIDILLLNDRVHLVNPRFSIGIEIIEKLEDILDFLDDYISGVNKTVKRKNKIIERLQKIMKQAIPTSEYSETCATVILNEPNYQAIKNNLESLKLWDNEFKDLEKEMKYCCLDINL